MLIMVMLFNFPSKKMDNFFNNESGVNVLRAHVSLLFWYWFCAPKLLIPLYLLYFIMICLSLRKAIWFLVSSCAKQTLGVSSYFRFLLKSLILVFFLFFIFLRSFLEFCTIVLDIQHSNLKYYICQHSLYTSQTKEKNKKKEKLCKIITHSIHTTTRTQKPQIPLLIVKYCAILPKNKPLTYHTYLAHMYRETKLSELQAKQLD